MLIEEMNGDSKNLFKVLFGAGQVGAVLSDEFIQVRCSFTGKWRVPNVKPQVF
jgi:hypothetical protein